MIPKDISISPYRFELKNRDAYSNRAVKVILEEVAKVSGGIVLNDGVSYATPISKSKQAELRAFMRGVMLMDWGD